jgi:hypothetical protein
MMVLRIATLGSKARQLLKAAETGVVWGATSRGIFIHLPPRGIIFLSFDTYPGPLTANLEGDKLFLKDLKSGDQATLAEGRLVFSRADLSLSWEDAEPWGAPLAPVEVLPGMAFLENYKAIERRVHGLRENSIPPIDLQLDQLDKGLQAFLGQGGGLTPAGDDIVLGCLLTLRRWGHKFLPAPDIGVLTQELVSAAYRQTTLLSANLIACAAEGQADERLMLALDGVFTGQPCAEHCANMLLSYGHSSGIEVFAGMGIVIKQIKPMMRTEKDGFI